MITRYRHTGLQYIPEIKISLTNLGAYTRGRLIYEEITLPVDFETLENAIHRVLNYDKDCKYNEDEEVFISEYETELDYSVREHTNVYELNDLLNNLHDALVSRTYMDIEEINAVIRACDGDIEQAMDHIENQDYTYIPDIDSLERLGIELAKEDARYKDLPDEVTQYFDYEAFGRDEDINALGGWFPDLRAYIDIWH